MEVPKFETKKELFAYLVKNKDRLTAQKKAATKFADGIAFNRPVYSINATKADSNSTMISAEIVINTTLLFDSHKDVHMDGLWNRSVKNDTYTILNKNHSAEFEDVITEGENIKVSVKTFRWSELGQTFKGSTEALTYDADIYKEDNPYMFKKYITGKVRNHSVEMQYIKIKLAVNDEDYDDEYEEWQKSYPKIANKEDVKESGYFWAVYEAKHVGGAAVTKGSNYATPTRSIKGDPERSTRKHDPEQSTHDEIINEIHTNFKLLKN